MILTLDIGISVINIGGFEGDAPSFVAHIASDTQKTYDEYAVSILSVLALHSVDRSAITGTVMSSVLPELNPVIKKALSFLFGKDPLTVGPGIKTGLSIRCDIPSSVGGDLICASLAAHKLYGSPALIVDIDTATKMTLINSDGAFVGTSILPGVLMGLDALSSSAALLPTVELAPPVRVIGKNTADCMRSGIIYGNASMIDGMIDRIIAENAEAQLIITGSQAHILTPYLNHDYILDEHLVLRGLKMIYDKNN